MSNPYTMMLRKRKNFGRCPYHGQTCDVCDAIRVSFERCKEKKEIFDMFGEGYNTRVQQLADKLF